MIKRVEKQSFLGYNEKNAGKIRIKMRSRIHGVLVGVGEFHPKKRVMDLIPLRKIPAFLRYKENLLMLYAFIQQQENIRFLFTLKVPVSK